MGYGLDLKAWQLLGRHSILVKLFVELLIFYLEHKERMVVGVKEYVSLMKNVDQIWYKLHGL
ncbi:hypothetical protein F8388_005592 [Cannabis sativa]|uniref:Uncharacterized protein n=1 Tax=Cannabis sativa TaxID=3483 RepID=A0A7J6GYP8_CANSA|nr:hypothetical protein F8388_005592 [Cannabis sativa]